MHLRVSEDADTHYDWELKAIADESGNIVNYEFYPRKDEIYHHIGMRFYLTATGIASQALTTFTDAGSIALNPSSGQVGTSVVVTAGGGCIRQQLERRNLLGQRLGYASEDVLDKQWWQLP